MSKRGRPSSCLSQFRGVTYDKSEGLWRARVWNRKTGKRFHVGRFTSERDAAQAIDCALLALHGPGDGDALRCLNFSQKDAARHLPRHQADPAFARIAHAAAPAACPSGGGGGGGGSEGGSSTAVGDAGGECGGRKRAASPGGEDDEEIRRAPPARGGARGAAAAAREPPGGPRPAGMGPGREQLPDPDGSSDPGQLSDRDRGLSPPLEAPPPGAQLPADAQLLAEQLLGALQDQRARALRRVQLQQLLAARQAELLLLQMQEEDLLMQSAAQPAAPASPPPPAAQLPLELASQQLLWLCVGWDPLAPAAGQGPPAQPALAAPPLPPAALPPPQRVAPGSPGGHAGGAGAPPAPPPLFLPTA